MAIDKRSQTWIETTKYATARITALQQTLEDKSTDAALTASCRGAIREMRDLLKLDDASEKLNLGETSGDYGVGT